MPFTYRVKPLREWARTVFTLDARSLALYRIALGLMVISDHVMRAFGMKWFYTNSGVYPTSAIWKWVRDFRKPCVHALSGGIDLQVFLFALAGLAAVLLIVGWHTRIMAVICWFLTISIQHRFVQINSGADIFLAGILFWSMFLPLGARYSLDARRRPDKSPKSHEVLSGATACIVLQLVLVYYFNVANKYGWAWRDGSAVLRALHIDQYATPLGVWVRDAIPWITYPLARMTIVIESAVVLLLIPWWKGRTRIALVAAFWALHIGFNVNMYLALFSPISMTAWLAVLPAEAWERLPGLRRWNLRMRRGLGAPRRPSRLLAVALLTTFFVLPVWANVEKTYKWKRPAKVTRAARFVRLNQVWKMFAPSPLRTDFWWVVEGRTKSGKKVDLMRDGAPLTWKKPEYASQMYLTGKHRRLWMSLKCKKKALRCKRVLDRACRDHNNELDEDDPDRVVRTILWKMKERTPKNLKTSPTVKKHREFRRQCPSSRKKIRRKKPKKPKAAEGKVATPKRRKGKGKGEGKSKAASAAKERLEDAVAPNKLQPRGRVEPKPEPAPPAGR